MKKIVLLFALIVSMNGAFSQNKDLGKVTIDELNEKQHKTDTSAVASILFQKGRSYFVYSANEGFMTITEVETKIKIYKKEGYDWANKSIAFYSPGEDNERVEFSKAVSYNLVDGKIVKTKLQKEGEFKEKVDKYYSRAKITMPAVKEGTIIEFVYRITSPYSSFPDWNFQQSIPVAYSEFTTSIPEYFIFKNFSKGFLNPIIEKTTANKTVNISSSQLVRQGRAIIPQRSDDSFSYREDITTYRLQDIPALNDESFVNNIDNYRASIQHELSGKQMPNSMFKSYANTWEDVAKKIYESEDFGDQLSKTNYFEKDLDEVIKSTTTNEEKIAAIFNFVKNRMNWNDYRGYNCEQGVKKAYETKTGNVADINLMLVSMLKYAGLDANPVLISTRDNGIALFPSRNSFNYVIASVNLEGKNIMLDATSKSTAVNVVPIRVLNWFGRIIKKDGSSEMLDLMPQDISKDAVIMIATIQADGKLSGQIREQYFDYNAYLFRSNNGDLTEDAYLEELEGNFKGLEVSEYKVDNKSENNKPVIETYKFEYSGAVDVIGDKIYFSPLFFLSMKENPFKQDKREYPIDFVFPNQDKYAITITIPDGYVVEYLPESISMPFGDNQMLFKLLTSNTDKQIQISLNLDYNTSLISAEYYADLKLYFAEIVKRETEKIILKKI
jgi:Domain of Unknown Function with PDB structure (DUF3857)/Transglutaminase-like superfamily